jgi:hypothetical protein
MRKMTRKAFMLVAVLTLSIANFGFANGAFAEEVLASDFKYVTYVVKNKHQFVFAYSSNHVQRVSLVIRNHKGNEIHRDFFVEKELGRVYDLSKYGNGTYFLEVKTGDFYEKKEIIINAEESLAAEVNSLDNKKVELSFKNNADSPVFISINDVKGETVYNESAEVKKGTRIYDLTNLPTGEYVIIISNNNKSIGQIVKVKK